MAALTLGATGSVPSHGAEALAPRSGRGLDVDALAVATAVLVGGALIFELATVAAVQRIAPAPARNGPSPPVAVFDILRSWN